MADLEHITAEGETYDISDATARAHNDEQDETISALQTENAELKAQIAEMEEEISELNSDLDTLNADLTDLDWRGLGTNIPNNSDLNDYTTPGKYYVISNAIAETITNCPETSYAFTLIVMYINSTTRYVQIIFSINSINPMHFRTYGTNGWASWRRVTTTEIST